MGLSEDLRYDRPLETQELRMLTAVNLVVFNIASSAHYASDISTDDGVGAIRHALATMQHHVPALGTVVARHPVDDQPWFARLQSPIVPRIDIIRVADLKPDSPSFHDTVAPLMEQPFSIEDMEPAWRAYILLSQTSEDSFEARVLFILAHLIFDAPSGAFLHEQLSELLADPSHTLWTRVPVPLAMPPPSRAIWALQPPLIVRIWTWWRLRVLKPFQRFVDRHIRGVKSVWPDSRRLRMTFETLMFDNAFVDKLLVQGRSHGATWTHILASVATEALRKTIDERTVPSKIPSVILPNIPLAKRPDFRFERYFGPGPEYRAAKLPCAFLPPTSAFQRLVGFYFIGLAYPHSRRKWFWDDCKAVRDVFDPKTGLVRKLVLGLEAEYSMGMRVAPTLSRSERKDGGKLMLTGAEGDLVYEAGLPPQGHKLVMTNVTRANFRCSDKWRVGRLAWTWTPSHVIRAILMTSAGDSQGSTIQLSWHDDMLSHAEAKKLMSRTRQGLQKIAAGFDGELDRLFA